MILTSNFGEGSSNNKAEIQTDRIEKNLIPQKTWLFVGNLTVDTRKEEFVEIFSRHGKLIKAFVMADKGFAFVQMDSRANAEKAKNDMDGKNIHGKLICVKYVTRGAAVSVTNLPPVVSNELLEEAFSKFGKVERAVVIVDNKGQSTTRGIVEFNSELSAQSAVRQIQEGCFLMTASPRVISASLMEQEDSDDGLPEENLIKSSLYYSERKVHPRFAEQGSFEEQCARKWKARDALEREQREELERNLRESRKIFELEMENDVLEQETMLMKHDLLCIQGKERERFEKGNKELEGSRQLEMIRMDTDKMEIVESQHRQGIIGDEEQINDSITKSEFDLNKEPNCSNNGNEIETNERDSSKMAMLHKCLKQYSLKTNLAGRMKIHDKSKRRKCQVCSKIFGSTYKYSEHMRTHTGEKPFKCTICNRAFGQFSHLKEHRYIHDAVKKFKCPECPDEKWFRTPHNLQMHMIVHKEKRFECYKCKMRFHRSSDWKVHEQVHLKPHACGYCKKRFARPGNLKTHIRIHTGEKPFKCETCDMKYSSKDSLRRHMKKCKTTASN